MCLLDLIRVPIHACVVAVPCVLGDSGSGLPSRATLVAVPRHTDDDQPLPIRLGTPTKESNICASSGAGRPAGPMKATPRTFAPATNQSSERGVSMSIAVRIRKIIN